MVIAETAVPSARLQGLGLKQYPSNMQRHAQQRPYLIESFLSTLKSRERKKGSA